jgi:hypothetical protein
LGEFFKLISEKDQDSAYKHLKTPSADDSADSSTGTSLFENDDVLSSSSQERADGGSAASESLNPLLFLAKSFMDHVMDNSAKEAGQICIFMQNDFPERHKTFLFDQVPYPVSFTQKVTAELSRSLLQKIDLSFQLEAKQKNFDDAIRALLGVGAGQQDSAGYGSGALVACKTIRKSLDNLKLLEAFKYFLFSDDLFCKVRVFDFYDVQ